MLLRHAEERDLVGILDIYNRAVLTSTAIWNDTPVDLANRRAWLADRISKRYPVMVAVEEGGDAAAPGEPRLGEPRLGEPRFGRQALGQQPLGEQALGQQALGQQALGQQALGQQPPGPQVLGFASFGDFRPFDGYRISVEHSVYVAEDARGRGIGRQLVGALFEPARALGKKVMIGGITAGNAASIALHARLGFEPSGHMRGIGIKFGQRLDLVLMQKEL